VHSNGKSQHVWCFSPHHHRSSKWVMLLACQGWFSSTKSPGEYPYDGNDGHLFADSKKMQNSWPVDHDFWNVQYHGVPIFGFSGRSEKFLSLCHDFPSMAEWGPWNKGERQMVLAQTHWHPVALNPWVYDPYPYRKIQIWTHFGVWILHFQRLNMKLFIKYLPWISTIYIIFIYVLEVQKT